jgi:hypothetical protein
LASWRPLRLLPLSIGALSMLFGLYTGLIRLGIPLADGLMPPASFHSAFMISGFLGTVISLERAVALGRTWPYAGPLLSSLGAVALVADAPHFAALAFTLAGGVMLLACADVAVRQLALFTLVLSVGAACWIAGTLQWRFGDFTPAATGWWLNFLVLTIAAERLELSRMRGLSRPSQIAFTLAIVLLLIGSGRGELAKSWAPMTAAGLFGCAAWLLRHDIARRTVGIAGQPRFAAVAILTGHAWLGVAGVLLAVAPLGAMSLSFDASVHAITIGFALSMIFAHASIILPAITGIHVRYSGVAYGPLALLNGSLILRIAGDVLDQGDLRTAGGVITILALAADAATLVLASTTARRTG